MSGETLQHSAYPVGRVTKGFRCVCNVFFLYRMVILYKEACTSFALPNFNLAVWFVQTMGINTRSQNAWSWCSVYLGLWIQPAQTPPGGLPWDPPACGAPEPCPRGSLQPRQGKPPWQPKQPAPPGRDHTPVYQEYSEAAPITLHHSLPSRAKTSLLQLGQWQTSYCQSNYTSLTPPVMIVTTLLYFK